MLLLLFGIVPGYTFGADNSYVFYTGVQSPIKEILQLRLEEAFKRIGEKAQLIHTGSAQRALVMANEEGDGDAMRVPDIKKIAPDITQNLVIVPEPILEIQFYVYTQKKGVKVDGFQSLAGLNNGFRVGAKILEKNIPEKRTILPDSVRLFKMLAQGRLDTVIEHNMIAEYIKKELDIFGVKRLEPPLVTVPGFCFVHRKNIHLVNKLANSLSEIKKDGSFLKIEKSILH